MKLSLLKKLIKEEIAQTLEEGRITADPEITHQVLMIADNDGDLYRAYKAGEMPAEKVVKKAAEEYYKWERNNLRESIFNEGQIEEMVREYTKLDKE